MKERLKRQQELKYQSGFEKGSIEERTEPKRLLPEAQSIISIAVAYPSRLEKTPRGTKGDRRGIFARASWGIDYHIALRERLDKLGEYIKARVPDAIIKSMVDTGELSDRPLLNGLVWALAAKIRRLLQRSMVPLFIWEKC